MTLSELIVVGKVALIQYDNNYLFDLKNVLLGCYENVKVSLNHSIMNNQISNIDNFYFSVNHRYKSCILNIIMICNIKSKKKMTQSKNQQLQRLFFGSDFN